MSKNFLSGHRNWNILAFRGRLMSLLELRSAGSHRGLWDCDYSPHRKHFLPQDKEGFGSDTSHAEKAVFFFKESRIFHLLGWFFIHKGLLYYFYKMYQRLLFVNSKHYIVDWNGRRRLLGLGLRTARPIENHCDYSTHRKHLRE